jgi:membrane protein DedA with SNARE-associated domain/rhodanese-related sulfurtransferase
VTSDEAQPAPRDAASQFSAEESMQLLLTLVEHYGLWLVFANVLASQLGLPVPAYPTLIVVGALTSRGDTTAPEVIATASAASLIADCAWYFAGARYGRRVLMLMCRVSLSPDTCVRQTENIYERWGAPSLTVAKFVPGFAMIATSVAGLMRTRLWTFALFDLLGALLWSGVAVAVGWLFRDAVNDVLSAFNQAGRWGLMGLVIALTLYVAVKALQRHRLIRSLRIARVSVEELNRMLATQERLLIVDVRSLSSQKTGRIPGAIWIDSHSFDESLESKGLGDRMTHEVIVYCACPNEASAAVVAKKLFRAGFKRVRPLHGGIEAWIEKGYAVEIAD